MPSIFHSPLLFNDMKSSFSQNAKELSVRRKFSIVYKFCFSRWEKIPHELDVEVFFQLISLITIRILKKGHEQSTQGFSRLEESWCSVRQSRILTNCFCPNKGVCPINSGQRTTRDSDLLARAPRSLSSFLPFLPFSYLINMMLES